MTDETPEEGWDDWRNRVYTARTLPDGSPDHYQEALRLLELADVEGPREAPGAQYYAAAAQVHATLYAAEIDRISMKVVSAARIAQRQSALTESERAVLSL